MIARFHPPRLPVENPRSGAVRKLLLPITLTVGLLGATAYGLPYYRLALEDRVRHPLHAWLRPSGYVGQSLGLLALAIFLFLWLYPFRKKYRWLAWTGRVGSWLDIHVGVALTMPLLVAVHAGWRFEGMIGIGYAAIVIVCLSGVVGRYLYTRIPRSKSGVELTRDQMASERQSLLGEITVATGLTPTEIDRRLGTRGGEVPDSLLAGFVALVRQDLARRRALRDFRYQLAHRGPGAPSLDRSTLHRVTRLASREAALSHQARMLDATHRAFKFWHVAHRPVAVTALITVVVHLVVVVGLGATWFR